MHSDQLSQFTNMIDSNGTTILTSTTTGSPQPPYMNDITTVKIISLILLSFSIPAAFMILLFWRLQKEKKYMNARAGALVYRETVLVPSYTIPDNDGNANTNVNYSNVIQMHSALYDTPPEYDAVINPSARVGSLENEATKSKSCKSEELPPPSYSTVYI